MTSAEIRNSFLEYFREHGHKILPSAPVIPYDDPTLLFTNAGMNQFKNIFLGLERRDYTRVANSQKCIRVSGKHNDLEEVGKDTYHHTFFEMLGNWSFGDYYKKEAIEFAWELLTEVWKLPKERLWATVFEEDDEAEELWREVTDIGHDRILRFDEKENFWEMGEVGPCGPCSEIHFDLGEKNCTKKGDKDHRCGVNAGCGRFIELWNLVFIQYNREEDGSLTELPAKHIDTGMGFERLVAILQGVDSNYDTDLFTPLISEISTITGVRYQEQEVAHRVIADHIRALTFAIADGAIPSNEGRGYVLRRILRRAARFGRLLGMHEPFIYKLVPVVVDVMGQAYPEIVEKHQYISLVIKSEEESFSNTLDRGLEIFEEIVADLEKKGQKRIPGPQAFRLYDTYGFPLDLTQLMARERGFTVDERGFKREMEAQRRRAREAGQWEYEVELNPEEWETLSQGEDSLFVGYEKLEIDAEIRRIKREGDRVFVTLNATPFYAEAGGQVGDQGEISGEGFSIRVLDTHRVGERIIHVGELEGRIRSPKVRAKVHFQRRLATARNHTATHLLHRALKEILGEHVNQSGSLVAPDRLRFDFTHFERISQDQLEEIERRVNKKIWENLPVEAFETSFTEAKKMGAVALFGEKYGERVRVVKIGDYSLELCGGTHLQATGQIGCFRILSESSAAAGIRRIEAVTGEVAFDLLQQERREMEKVKRLLNCRVDEISDRLAEILEERKSLEKELVETRLRASRAEIARLVKGAKEMDGFRIVASIIQSSDIEELKRLGDILREELGSGVGVLGAVINDKASFICVVTQDLIKNRGLKAGDIVRQVAEIAGGGGGGKPHMALAGGKEVSKIKEALMGVEGIVRKMIEKN